MKRIPIAALALCVLLLPSACAQTAPDGATTEPAQIAETTEQTAAAAPEETSAPSLSEEASTLRNLPGHIASDVYVRLWDGSVAPGLRAEDAETVKSILASQTWGFSYDNLSDAWIDAEGVPYAYDSSAGILTASDDRAAKLTEEERIEINAILAEYLPGYE